MAGYSNGSILRASSSFYMTFVILYDVLMKLVKLQRTYG